MADRCRCNEFYSGRWGRVPHYLYRRGTALALAEDVASGIDQDVNEALKRERLEQEYPALTKHDIDLLIPYYLSQDDVASNIEKAAEGALKEQNQIASQ